MILPGHFGCSSVLLSTKAWSGYIVSMRFWSPENTVTAVLILVAGMSFIAWTGLAVVDDLKLRVPDMDLVAIADVEERGVAVVGKVRLGTGRESDLPGSWPRFRGADFNGISNDDTKLARAWPDGGPKKLWTVSMGEGHAAAAVHDGRVYVLDYDREEQADAMRCLSLGDGKEIWRFSYPVRIKRNHGMSRTIPAVTKEYVLGFGPKCHVFCLDAKSGKCHWLIDLVAEFNAIVPQWYAGQCPLIDDGKAIIATGGASLMVAIDCESGDVVWRSPNPRGWEMTHSSIMPMEFGGRRTYVYCAQGGVVGVAADNGELLWNSTDWKIRIATVPSAMILPNNRLFFSGGYNSGAMMAQIEEQGGDIGVETLFRLKPKRFGSTQQTPIFYNGFIYGVRDSDKQLVCLDLKGNEVWRSGRQHKFGLGPYVISDGLIFVLDDSARLTLVEATSSGYHQLAQALILEDAQDAWGPMAVAAGRLILRDLTRMVCLDVADRQNFTSLQKGK